MEFFRKMFRGSQDSIDSVEGKDDEVTFKSSEKIISPAKYNNINEGNMKQIDKKDTGAIENTEYYSNQLSQFREKDHVTYHTYFQQNPNTFSKHTIISDPDNPAPEYLKEKKRAEATSTVPQGIVFPDDLIDEELMKNPDSFEIKPSIHQQKKENKREEPQQPK